MFRATMCPSSGETTVFMWHLVLVILCGWLSGMQEHMLLHTRNYVSIIGRNNCVYVTLDIVILCGWLVCMSICFCIPDTMCQSSGETTVFMWHLVLVIFCGWLSGIHVGIGGIHSTLHTRQSSTQNNKYQVSNKHSCFSWWWANSRPKHVEIDKYTENKLWAKLALFTGVYRDARPKK
jgi:hypothetical protein